MNTPITDAALTPAGNCFWSDPVIHAWLARTLEADRAALMSKLEASERHLAKLYAHTVADESGEIEEDGWILLCGVRSALTAARANFPES